MFILSLTYTVPLDQVDALRDAHIAWLKAGRDAGHFDGWGRKAPPTGGVIFAKGAREDIVALAQTDPFITGGVATVEVIEFVPSFLAMEPVNP